MQRASMPQDRGAATPEKQVSAHMAQSIRHAFCTAVNASGLPPMAVLELAALALGAVYKEAAAAHCGPHGCACGWHPDTSADLAALRRAIGVAFTRQTGLDLRALAPLGNG